MRSIIAMWGVSGLAVFAFAPSADASSLFASSYDKRKIFTINQTTGAGSAIGPVFPMSDIRDMASDPRAGSFRLWATSQSTGQLFRLDPTSGGGKLVGSYGLPQGEQMRTLGFDAVAGKLYGTSEGAASNKLYEIDPDTGSAALIGATGIPSIGGIAADSSGTLYGVRQNTSELFRIDKATGALTKVVTVAPMGLLSDLAFRPEDDALYAITHNGSSGLDRSVFTINLATGAATRLGFYGEEVEIMAGLAFGPAEAEAQFAQLALPEPGTAAVLVFGALAMAGRRRR